MSQPFLTLCIATSRRPTLLVQCLQSVAEQQFDKENLEVLVPVENHELESLKTCAPISPCL